MALITDVDISILVSKLCILTTLQLKIIFAYISCFLRQRSNKTSEVFSKSLSIHYLQIIFV